MIVHQLTGRAMVDNHEVDRTFVTLERPKNAHIRAPFFFKWYTLAVGNVGKNCLVLLSPFDCTSDSLVLEVEQSEQTKNVSRGEVDCAATLLASMQLTASALSMPLLAKGSFALESKYRRRKISSYGGFTSRASSFRSANRVFNSSRCFRCKSMRSSISPRAIFLDGDGGVFAAIDAISQAMIARGCVVWYNQTRPSWPFSLVNRCCVANVVVNGRCVHLLLMMTTW